MKLLSLNLWGGRVREQLLEFLKQRSDMDIFCFQEIYNNSPTPMTDNPREADLKLFDTLQKTLPEYQVFFSSIIKDIFGIAMFVRKDTEVLDNGELFIYENPDYALWGGNHSRKLQWIKCRFDGKIYHIMNLHGIWDGGEGRKKTDTPARLIQSQRIKELMDSLPGPKILCGDFNLRPDTKSLEILEEGMENLIKTHHVPTTRSKLYDGEGKFADYMLVSPDIKVIDFQVLPDLISDHMPLYLELT